MVKENVTLSEDVTMPMVGFGTWQLRGEEAYEATRYALEVGYRHLDTATMYRNEAEVGRAVRDSGIPREEIFLTTKLQPGDAGREREILSHSLQALDTDYLDLWLIHSPTRRHDGLATWQEFLAARDRRQVRAAGVSNYELSQLDTLIDNTGEAPAVNQVPWGPDWHDPHVLSENHRRHVVLEGYSPLKNTRLSDPVLVEIAEAHQVTPAQVVLRWHLEHEIPIIPKSGTRERIATNFDLFGFSLSTEEIARIDAM